MHGENMEEPCHLPGWYLFIFYDLVHVLKAIIKLANLRALSDTAHGPPPLAGGLHSTNTLEPTK